MIGFSIYLDHELTAADHDYMLRMRNAGFSGVFTSLCPEVAPAELLARLQELTKWCSDLGLTCLTDVSAAALARLGIATNDRDALAALHVTSFRLGAGFSLPEIAELSAQFVLYLNANLMTSTHLDELKSYSANLANIAVAHEAYPRPATGLDTEWFLRQNAWLKQAGLKVLAFVAGDGCLSGPLKQGLPTLEQDRYRNPLAEILGMKAMGLAEIYIADCRLSEASLAQLEYYQKQHGFLLHLEQAVPALSEAAWHQRSDVARDVVRLAEGPSRQLELTGPVLARSIGAITLDQGPAAPLPGELEIMKVAWPAVAGVVTVAQVSAYDLSLLGLIGASAPIKFATNKNS